MSPLLALLAACAVGAADKPDKHALIIAIADYPDEQGYVDLNASNDVPLVEGALRRQGFAKRDITVLTDSDATVEGITAALEDLTARVSPGDVVFVHYSGHGHRITDDNGDEPDGYDEVLVAWGAPLHPPDGYAGERHLRDDTLGALLGALRTKLGPEGSLMVSIDACHSGSATRGAEELPVRGVATPLGPPASGARGADEGSGAVETPGDPAAMAPFVVFSAASHDERAHETRDPRGKKEVVGGLSLAMSHALARADPGMTSRELFEQIRGEMASTVPHQTPQIEGDVDMLVLRGEVVEQAAYLPVLGVTEAGEVEVGGGTLVGLTEGARVAFHPPGTHDPDAATPLATGEVVSAKADAAKVRPEGAAADALADAWVFVTEEAFGGLTLQVALDEGLPAALRRDLSAALAKSRVVDAATDAPDLVFREVDGQGIMMVSAAEGAVLAGPFAADAPKALLDAAVGYARNRYLRGLALSASGLDVRLEVLPAEPRFSAAGDFLGCRPTVEAAPAGPQRFVEGEAYMLRFTNEGRYEAWITVLELLADGGITQLYPFGDALSSDHRLEPRKQYLVQDPCFVAEAPFGTEVIKLFATRERVDFRPILDKGPLAAATRSDAPSPLELLLVDTYDGAPTRSGAMRMPQGTAATASVTLTITPAE
ncbi:MAG: caspase family protein [Alphaproteobacteria bacterium]|nr:caspase family protein [Alphaproteobacteria bacterium]